MKILAGALLLVAMSAFARLLPSEIKGIQDTLYVGNLSLKDLDYSRRPYNDVYRLPLVNLGLEHPIEAANRLMDLHEAGLRSSVSALLKIASQEMLNDAKSPPLLSTQRSAREILIPSGIPESVRPLIQSLVVAVLQANDELAVALDGLSPKERETLIQSLPQWATEEPSIQFDFVYLAQAKQEEILRLLAKVKLAAIPQIAQRLSQSIESKMPALKAAAAKLTWIDSVAFTVDGLRIVVSGVGDDVHKNEDAGLVVDLGGNDRYTGRVASGVGKTAVLIDVGGDDTYEVGDASMGAGLLGIGLAYDLGGNDRFNAKSLSLGAGIAGVGVLYKEGGEDIYQGYALTEGYGEFGVGALIDTGGNDFYEAKVDGQGAARTRGVGWLIDRSGDDTYRAGGLIPNVPLFKNVNYSNAQGYASGYREDAFGGLSGGIGLLSDGAGDDAYIAETYAQASSYWFSLGTLYDRSGNDTYQAYHYSQASAMHMTAAYFFDLAGDDKYTVSWGASFGIGHDYGVAMMLDRAGNDIYAAGGTSPANGISNGVGIFVDGQGDDRFTGVPGAGNAARGSGSIAVFTHLNGHGKYNGGLDEGQATATPSWGVALDTSGGPVDPALPPYPKVGSLRMVSDKKLEEIYQVSMEWDVGTARKRVAVAKGRFIGMGLPALKWMIAKHLAAADATQLYIFAEVIRQIGPQARQEIARSINDPNDQAAKMAARIAYELQATEAAPFLPAALKRPFVQRTAVMAAGAVGSRESIPQLIELVHSDDKITARCALVSLAQLGAHEALATAQEFLFSSELPLRKASIDLLAKLPEGVALAKSLLKKKNEHAARTGIEILSANGSPDALELIGRSLSDSRPGIRIQALTSLRGRFPEKFKKALSACARDKNPLVKAVAERALAELVLPAKS